MDVEKDRILYTCTCCGYNFSITIVDSILIITGCDDKKERTHNRCKYQQYCAVRRKYHKNCPITKQERHSVEINSMKFLFYTVKGILEKHGICGIQYGDVFSYKNIFQLKRFLNKNYHFRSASKCKIRFIWTGKWHLILYLHSPDKNHRKTVRMFFKIWLLKDFLRCLKSFIIELITKKESLQSTKKFWGFNFWTLRFARKKDFA